MTSEANFTHDAELFSLYELVLAHLEEIAPGTAAHQHVRDTVASALTSLKAAGQNDREVLRRYAEHQALLAARLRKPPRH